MAKPGTNAQSENEFIEAYRADPKGRYGGKDNMETLPLKFNRRAVQNYMKAYSIGKKYGAPTDLTPEDFYALLMKEGTTTGMDLFGVNKYNKNDKASGEIYMKTYLELVKEGMEPNEADNLAKFPAALYDHSKRSRANGISFGHSWTGLGYAKRTGKTGKESGELMNQQYAGSDYQKNEDLLETMRHWGGFGPKPKPQKRADVQEVMPEIEKTLSDLSAVREKEQPNAAQIPGMPV
jgi:hypothetical protein